MTAWETPWIWSIVKHVKIVKEQPFKVSGNGSGGTEQMKKLYSRKSTRDFKEKWDSIVFEVGPVFPSDLPAQGGRNSIPDWYNQGHSTPSSPRGLPRGCQYFSSWLQLPALKLSSQMNVAKRCVLRGRGLPSSMKPPLVWCRLYLTCGAAQALTAIVLVCKVGVPQWEPSQEDLRVLFASPLPIPPGAQLLQQRYQWRAIYHHRSIFQRQGLEMLPVGRRETIKQTVSNLFSEKYWLHLQQKDKGALKNNQSPGERQLRGDWRNLWTKRLIYSVVCWPRENKEGS